MSEELTILVVPRDRFSSLTKCVSSILKYTEKPFRLVVLDFGYTKKQLREMEAVCGSFPVEVVKMGLTIPMTALKQYLPKVETKYLAWIDNDTFVTEGWLTAIMDRVAKGARVVLPLTLELEGLGVDPRGIHARNHISHGELRKVEIDGEEYVFDFKPYRRAAQAEIPQDGNLTDFFEFHAIFGETDVWRQLDIPDIVMREHIDLGIQLNKLGIPIWCEPKSVVHFANIHDRPSITDLKYFHFRWNKKLVEEAHRVFEERWGYKFMNEQFIKNWAVQRWSFSLFRYCFLPQKPADFCSRVIKKLFCKPIPQKFLQDPLPRSERVLEPLETAAEQPEVSVSR